MLPLRFRQIKGIYMRVNKIYVISICGVLLSGCSSSVRSPQAEERWHYVTMSASAPSPMLQGQLQQNTARYTHHEANPIKQTAQEPLATFSLDVDTGSYANVRRFLKTGSLPDADVVRVEELVNYFPLTEATKKNIPGCKGCEQNSPFSINYELTPAPWNEKHTLLRLDIAANDIARSKLPPANLVFLIDTSGSMTSDERLPLIKSSLKLLVNELRDQDRISIVTYAGSARLLLPSTSGSEKNTILNAIANLQAGGGTNGGAGVAMAYEQAQAGYIKGGVNRILLATDGDFNIGDDPASVEDLVKKQRESGITLSTLGVGDNNYNEAMMVKIADTGNGNYSYLDSLSEAQKVLSNEMNQTLVTVAKDVKAQIEFNPQQVIEYRQIGYEKRQLRAEEFNNDAVDAGDIGAGKHVTVLFELTLAGQQASVDKLRYGKSPASAQTSNSNELMWVKLRYKAPQGESSRLVEMPIMSSAVTRDFSRASPDMHFLSAVAAYGQKLRGSEYLNKTSWQQIQSWAQEGKGADQYGYRAEFIQLVGLAESLSR